MCGRFALGIDLADLKQEAGFKNHVAFRPRYNIAPADMVLALKSVDYVDFLSWGFSPSWYQGKPLSNARIETIGEKPTFAKAYKKQRCIILATGYYEWASHRGDKQPYYIHGVKKKVLFLAGVYENNSCAIITTQATGRLASVHDRMPLIISEPDVRAWLSGKSIKNLSNILKNKTLLSYHRVSKRVNYPSYDNLECIEVLDF